MPAISQRQARALAALGVAGALLLLPSTWPGTSAWQPQLGSLSPADGIGQSLVLELESPLVLELPVAVHPSQSIDPSGMTADIIVLPPSRASYPGLPARLDASMSRARISLAGIQAGRGTRLQVSLHDPHKQIWIWATEHDSYVPGTRFAGDRPVGGDLAFRVTYRRSILEVLAEGVDVARREAGLILAVSVTAGAAGLLISGVLRRTTQLNLPALLSAGIGGGFLGTAVLGWSAALARLRLSAGLVLAVTVAVALLGLALWFDRGKPLPGLDLAAAVLALGLLVLGFLRLAFASALDLPPHVDSVLHFATVVDLLTPGQPPLGANPVGGLVSKYYHLGFHGMAAWVLALARQTSPHSLLVLGQVIQTAAIGAIYFPVYAALRDSTAGVGAVVFAGLGWSMPGYASNWAKYPALLSLAVVPFVVGLTILGAGVPERRDHRFSMAAGLGALGATLIHTRILFVLAAFLLSALVARGVLRGRLRVQAALTLSFVPVLSVLVASPTAFDSLRQSVGKLVEGQGGLSTLVILLLAPLAFRKHRLMTAAAILSIAILFVWLFVPPSLRYPFPLLDSAMVSMAMFLPMSIVGGLGVSSLASWLASQNPRSGSARAARGTIVALAAVYLALSLAGQRFSPGECCVIAREDDARVAAAASSLLPEGARVLVPYVPQEGSGPSPADGGAWVFPLSRRPIVLWPDDADLAAPSEHSRLCQEGVTHVYVGGTPFSFSREELAALPAFYRPTLVLPGAALYAVVGCEPPATRLPVVPASMLPRTGP